MIAPGNHYDCQKYEVNHGIPLYPSQESGRETSYHSLPLWVNDVIVVFGEESVVFFVDSVAVVVGDRVDEMSAWE